MREGHEEAAEQTVAQQLAFAKAHLLNWVDIFCADVASATEDGFYSALAAFTDAFIREDAAVLEDILN